MKKLVVLFVAIIVILTGCNLASGTIIEDLSETADGTLMEDDYAIPEVGLRWQERNAPIFIRDGFYDDFTYEKDGMRHVKYRRAMDSIEVNVTYDRDEDTIVIMPKKELGPIMFQFTLSCAPVTELDAHVCWQYACEFMHRNSNHDEWCHSFSEYSSPTETTQYYVLDIDGEEIYLADNVFFEINATIVTMMTLTEGSQEDIDC